MTTDIDAIIDAANAAPEAQDQPKDAKTEAREAENQEVKPSEPEAADNPEDKPDEMFPKKAVNALSRRDKQIGKLRAQLQQQQRENEQLKQKANPTKPEAKDSAPKEADFETYGDFLRAEARYAAKQEITERDTTNIQERVKETESRLEIERAAKRTEVAETARKAHADFDTILNKAFENIKLAPHVIEALDESENGALVLYTLAKEGIELDELNEMSLPKVAMTIARTEDKISAPKPKLISNAPAPLASVKGTGVAGKTDDDLVNEILAYVNK